jgi:hypothetical protein
MPTAVVLPNGRPPVDEGEAVVHLTQWRFLAGVSIPLLDELLGGVLGRGSRDEVRGDLAVPVRRAPPPSPPSTVR